MSEGSIDAPDHLGAAGTALGSSWLESYRARIPPPARRLPASLVIGTGVYPGLSNKLLSLVHLAGTAYNSTSTSCT